MLGIFGGGQLGKMLASSAAQLGVKTCVYDTYDAPAFLSCYDKIQASFDNEEKLREFSNKCSKIISEFEAVNQLAFSLFENKLLPGKKALEVAKNRLKEKKLCVSLDIPVAPFIALKGFEKNKLNDFYKKNGDYLIKTNEGGYDGKGQWRSLNGKVEDIGSGNFICEKKIELDKEYSCLIARRKTGECLFYPLSENVHISGILHKSHQVTTDFDKKIYNYTQKIAEALDVEGLLCVEYFLSKDGNITFNEMAPRPHNSFHWTLDSSFCNQFEQLIRIACDYPFGSPNSYQNFLMMNLIGEDMKQKEEYLHQKNKFYDYGKSDLRKERKMGHLNILI